MLHGSLTTQTFVTLLGNNRAEEEEINTTTTQEYNMETPKPEKNHNRCPSTPTLSQSKYLN